MYSGEKATWFGHLAAEAAYKWISNNNVSLNTGGLVVITMLTGKRNNHFELNVGSFMVSNSNKNNPDIYHLLGLGYRYLNHSTKDAVKLPQAHRIVFSKRCHSAYYNTFPTVNYTSI